MAAILYRTWGMGSWDAGTWDELRPEININKRMPRVKTGVSRMTDDDVLQLTENIIASATGKVELANSPVTLAQLTTLKTDCTTALDTESMAEDDLATSRTERANAFVELRAAIDGFAQHAGTVYKHDRAKLQAISLDVRSAPVPPGPLPAPVNLQSYTGDLEGTIFLQWERVLRRDYYIVQCAESPTGPWTQVYGGKLTRFTCKNLTPGAEYFFRVNAQGPAGVGPWSDITRKRAA
jgi:hypothetical protein